MLKPSTKHLISAHKKLTQVHPGYTHSHLRKAVATARKLRKSKIGSSSYRNQLISFDKKTY